MKALTLILTITFMSTLYSCGGSKNSSATIASTNASASPSSVAPTTAAITPIVKDGVQAVLAGDFAGSWSGYLDFGYTTIVINPNGAVTVTVSGSAPANRILVLRSSVYKILKTETKATTAIRLVDGVMLVTSYGKEEPFTKN